MKATMKDVALRAKVSIATVSNHLNNKNNIGIKTKERIDKAIKDLGYIPNSLARNLKQGKSKQILVVLPNNQDPYYANILSGIESYFDQRGYLINVAFTKDIPSNESSAIKRAIYNGIDGLILYTCKVDDSPFFKNEIEKRSIPYILLDRKVANLESSFIYIDTESTVYSITKNLLNNNHSKIGLFTGPKDYTTESLCQKGYRQAYLEADIPYDKRYLNHSLITKEEAFRLAIRVFRQFKFDAIIASSETIAKGVHEACILRHENLDIISLTNEYWSDLESNLGHFNTKKPAFQLGLESARMLKSQLNSPVLYERINQKLTDRYSQQTTKFKKIDHKFNNEKIDLIMLEDEMASYMSGFLPHFENQYNSKVSLRIYSQEKLEDEIIKASSKNQNTVFMYDIPWLPYLASSNILLNIRNLIEDYGPSKDIFITFDEYSKYKNGYYGLPVNYSPQLLFYRKDLFEDKNLQSEFEKIYKTPLRPPVTWNEFNAIAKFFTKSLTSQSPVSYGTVVPSIYSELLIPELLTRLWTFNGDLYDENYTPTIDNPIFKKAFESFIEVFDYIPKDHDLYTVPKCVDSFIKGECAMLITYASHIQVANDRDRSKILGKLGFAMTPGKKPLLGGWSLGISKNTPNKILAYSLVRWACSKTLSNYFAIADGQSPIKDVYSNDDISRNYPWFPLLLKSSNHFKTRSVPLIYKNQELKQIEIENILSEAILETKNRKEMIDTHLKKAQSKMTELFIEHNIISTF